MSETDATPVINSETTSGITVMRMALTQSVPIGAIASGADERGVLRCRKDNAKKDGSDEREKDAGAFFHHIIRSPPLMSNEAPVM
jgi:hypothetical protein